LDVYHGTPHRFPATETNPVGELDASKVGTGEGAQAYGRGIYLAEDPNIARQYAVSKGFPDIEALAQEVGIPISKEMRIAMVQSSNANQDVSKAVNALQNASREARLLPAEKLQTLIEKFREFKTPSLYTLDLPDEMVDRMLDWDKPFIEQPDNIKEMAKANLPASVYKRLLTEQTGDMVLVLGKYNGGSLQASKMMQQAGIPGIKYLDAFSRDGNSETKTRNFVVFPGEEKKVKVLRRE